MIDTPEYRHGVCDACRGRPYANPWGWSNTIRMMSYNAGYLRGKELNVKSAAIYQTAKI